MGPLKEKHSIIFLKRLKVSKIYLLLQIGKLPIYLNCCIKGSPKLKQLLKCVSKSVQNSQTGIEFALKILRK
jgi:hypothetical protein